MSSPRKLDEDKQKAFIEDYDKTLNEVVLFADAVHPTHAARPVGCWAPKQDKLAIEQTSGRERINIHGAINLESGQTRMIDVQTVAAEHGPSTGAAVALGHVLELRQEPAEPIRLGFVCQYFGL
jgi:hypothetical protein